MRRSFLEQLHFPHLVPKYALANSMLSYVIEWQYRSIRGERLVTVQGATIRNLLVIPTNSWAGFQGSRSDTGSQNGCEGARRRGLEAS